MTKAKELHNVQYTESELLNQLLEHPQRLLFVFNTTKTLLNTACLSLFFYLIFPICIGQELPFPLILLAVLFASTTLFLFTDTISKRVAEKRLKGLKRLSRSISIFSFFSKPFVSLFEAIFRLQEKLLPNRKKELSIDELSKSMDFTNEEIVEGKDLLEGLINFNDKSAVEIMTPREDMACLDITVSLPEIKNHVIEMHYSRIPIYEKTEDNIKGILYVKDLLPFLEKDENYRWQQLIRPAFFVPESKKIDTLLREFRSNKIHLAIVVDEYGGTSGLVTMEDVLEEIVGEISDEYDDERKPYVQLADGSLIFEGKTLLTDFFRIVEADEAEFEELTQEVDTLAGLILELKGDFPRRQEIITYKNYQFQVLEMSKRRIVKVKFTILDKNNEEE